MARLTEDQLKFILIGLVIENAQVRATASPIVHNAFLDVNSLGPEIDIALDEVNQYRLAAGISPIEIDQKFRQQVIDEILRGAERQGKMRYGT